MFRLNDVFEKLAAQFKGIGPSAPVNRKSKEPGQAPPPPQQGPLYAPPFHKDITQTVTKMGACADRPNITVQEKKKIRVSDKPLDIQVGIDFGTSATKVCYKVLHASENVHPITDWNPPAPYQSYSIPSVAAFDEKKKLLLGIEAADYLKKCPWDEGFTRFKLVMAGRMSADFRSVNLERHYERYAEKAGGNRELGNAEWITAAYLVYVIRKVREHLIYTLKTRNLDTRFNVCMPLQQMMTDDVWARFKIVLAVVQYADENCPTNATSDEIFNFIKCCFEQEKYKGSESSRIFAVPESLAQIFAYKQSVGKYEGIHAMIDVGGGSTDVSIGTINHNNEPRWFATKNIPNGMKNIEKYLFEQLIGATGSLAEVTSLLTTDPSPPEVTGIVDKGLKRIWDSSVDVWRQAYGKHPKQHCWSGNNVHMFLYGGGSHIRRSEEVFRESCIDPGWGPYQIHHFMKPANYNDPLDETPFSRMAVAYGLSYPEPELGKYGLPADIKPTEFTPRTRPDTPYIGICSEQ